MNGRDRGGQKPLYRQISEELQSDILSGIYRPGELLPPIRTLAQKLGVARNTVETAYQILEERGFVTGRRGVGYQVEDIRHSFLYDMSLGLPAQERTDEVPAPESGPSYVFLPGAGAQDWIPQRAWRQMFDTVYQSMGDSDKTGGASEELRRQIRRHLRKHRGLLCNEEQIVLYRNLEQAMDTIRRLPVNRLYVVPHHQGPLGNHMTPAQERRVLGLARVHRAYVVEDDVDSALVYGKSPYPTLFARDGGERVMLTGSIQWPVEALLKIQYVVYPVPLLSAVAAAEQGKQPPFSPLEQRTFQAVFQSGTWEDYLQRTNRKLAARRDLLEAALRRHLGSGAELYCLESGTVVNAVLASPADANAYLRTAHVRGLRLGARSWQDQRSRQQMLCLSFCYEGIGEQAIEPGAALAAEILRQTELTFL